MTQPELVIVGIDGSDCSDEALQWAERYATATGARLDLVIAWQWPMSYGTPIPLTGFDPEADARAMVEKAAASLSLPADRTTTTVEHGSAGIVLTKASAPAALLVVGTRGHGGLAGALVGSTSSYCVHHAHCPVVVVRGDHDGHRGAPGEK